MRSAVAFSCLLASLIAAPATASECPGNPGALGTSRTIVVDPSEHSLLGGHQYRESLPLNDKEVVITFDDGPLPPYSTRILDILAQECVKATFFMVGRMARSFPQIVRRTHDEGHTLANHSQSHPFNFHRMSVEDAAHEIEGGFQSIAAAVGDPAKVAPFFRFPGLLRQDSVEHYLRSKRVMAWSVDFMADDWTRINAHEIVRRALERLEAKGKGILLLHDIKPATALGLPDLLRELKARGYRVVHVVPAAAGRPATVTTADQWLVRQPPGREQVAQGEPSVWPRVLPYRVRAAATDDAGAERHELRRRDARRRRAGDAGVGAGDAARRRWRSRAAAVAGGGHHPRGVPGTRRPAGAGRGPFPLQPDHPRPRRQDRTSAGPTTRSPTRPMRISPGRSPSQAAATASPRPNPARPANRPTRHPKTRPSRATATGPAPMTRSATRSRSPSRKRAWRHPAARRFLSINQGWCGRLDSNQHGLPR